MVQQNMCLRTEKASFYSNFFEGIDYELYKYFGAHKKKYKGIEGIEFLVWAPNAEKIEVVGDFNFWYGRDFCMKKIDKRGIWQLFVGGLKGGDFYKYKIKTKKGNYIYKADPFAFCAEKRPNTASKIYDLTNKHWKDKWWMQNRMQRRPYNKPINIYELHLGSWKVENDDLISFSNLKDKLIPYVADMGYTHIEIMPIMEHPFDGSWGYQATGYYAITSRYGTPEDFKNFVEECHLFGIGVILDWVPGHFCNDEHGLKKFDGGSVYEPSRRECAENEQWGTTYFDFSKREVRNFLLSNAHYWLSEYHVDGLRVDAVACMLYLDYGKELNSVLNEFGTHENRGAIEFFRELSELLYREFPNMLLIAEESTTWPLVTAPTYEGGLGFNFKWNMGWMNDVLKYMSISPENRKYEHNLMTFSMTYAFSENFILPFSHDEVVHGKKSMLDKMPGTYWEKFANLRLLYGFMMGHPGKKLNFMGNEFGQFIEWDEKRELDWFLLNYDKHRELKEYVKKLNRFYLKEGAFFERDQSFEGFEWLEVNNAEDSVFAFRRIDSSGHEVIVVSNFTQAVHNTYKIGIPHQKNYREVLNSDWQLFGGSDIKNEELIESKNEYYNGFYHCIEMKIPPLATIYLKEERRDKKRKGLKKRKLRGERIEKTKKRNHSNDISRRSRYSS
ncbi:MAG: 1,4-alpha-glucan branching protein GlgB [Tissierellales bacterium]|jgi:1,4-alpha-glucan branching enzyme|nr:1,4-alpha-glucan branching protein GlgB [Tissierellales bacterium]